MKIWKLAALGLGLVAVSIAAPASAGQTYTPTPWCTRYGDGSGVCYGSPRAFRIASGSGDYALFAINPMPPSTTIRLSFYASYGNTYVSCTRSVLDNDVFGRSMVDRWLALAPDTSFEMDWDSSGKCTYFSTGLNSYYLP